MKCNKISKGKVPNLFAIVRNYYTECSISTFTEFSGI